MTRRNLVAVALLTLFTFGIYWLYWIYATTKELKQVSGKEELNPTLDLVLSLVTCFVWGIWAEYRNAKLTHELISARGGSHDDRSMVILLLNIAAVFVGLTGLVAVVLLQEDLNKLAETAGGVQRLEPIERARVT